MARHGWCDDCGAALDEFDTPMVMAPSCLDVMPPAFRHVRGLRVRDVQPARLHSVMDRLGAGFAPPCRLAALQGEVSRLMGAIDRIA